MFDEDFKLNKSNILMIIITAISIIILIVMIILLIISFSNPVSDLPTLEISQGKTSTVSPRTTTTTTTTETTTTTTAPLKSPYYTVNVSSLLSNELFTKSKLTRSEAEEVAKEIYEVANAFYNISDNSLLNINLVINHAKSSESDKITQDGNNYGQVYNYDELVDKLVIDSYKYSLLNIKYDNNLIFIQKNNKYYRLENKLDEVYPVFVSLTVSTYNEYQINCEVRYYLSNYLETGATSPVYKVSNLTLAFENNRWKIKEYKFPLYE